ncbi:peptidylprolyl isomerase [Chitinimonas sp. BJB300]|uniref:peptidylprolyl isomerase n=1 Tax=Chitinimonas sp. BJB300 TaxID=1559339 RepID=UPI000C0E4969|nr:peptidylprolyl isomerase [Chitinimonas sp. BJB300]PHV12380.1 molecular chaperone SurA [Chitinimonas sp. BJB300]TSJ91090.1 molecular chaperone SurA [Chitinimonas sp. BJB300]
MRPISRLATSLVAAALFLSANAEPVSLDRIVAVVNKSVITEYELNVRIQSVVQNFARQKVSPPANDVLRQQVLERLVNERVQTDFAADTGLRVDDRQLDQTVERIAEQNKLSQVQFRQALEKEGTNFKAFREQIRQDLLLQRLREREVDSRVFVTDVEVDQYLTAAKGSDRAEQEYKLGHILIAIPEGAGPDVVAQRSLRAESARRALDSGKAFAEVAAGFSEAGDALQGGDLGWRSAGRLPPLFLEAVDQLKPGQYTPVLRSPAGFHIIKLSETRQRDGKEVVRQTHARHLLIKVNELTSDTDAKQRISEIRERVVNGVDFAEQAKLHSEDGSAQKGGDLDWISPGDTVPDFEQAMNALNPGDLSQPIKTPFGWHLIQVLERRDQDVTHERQKVRVRTELRERKADEQYEDWSRQMRDQAFVELRLDDK